MDSDEHGLLSALRKSQLKDGDIRGELYRKAIDALDMGENNYLILLAANIYNALYYAQKPAELHQEFIDAIFRTESANKKSSHKCKNFARLTESITS